MRNIDEMLQVPASTSPELDRSTLMVLPQGPVVYLEARDWAIGTLPRQARLDYDDGPVRVWRWDISTLSFDTGGFQYEESLAMLLSNYSVRYLKLPRLSCRKTYTSIANRSQVVTRRLHLNGMKEGTLINLTDGTRRAGVKVIGTAVVVSAERQLLFNMPGSDLALEGFPGWDLASFRNMFRKMHSLRDNAVPVVWRIQFRYL